MKFPCLIAVTASLLIFGVASATKAATKFDGGWAVTLDAKEFRNGDGSIAKPYIRNFSATVRDGVLHGEVGTAGKQGSYELNGTIEPDGTASLTAKEVLAFQKYAFTTSHR